jgi:ParB/RepB/Spo0J family partition protein
MLEPISIKIASVVLPQQWSRDRITRLDSMIESLSSKGQLAPILVRKSITPGKYEVIDGHRRLAAMIEMGWVEAQANVMPVTNEADAFTIALAFATTSEENTAYELARSVHLLVDYHDQTVEEVAHACGLDLDYVKNCVAVMHLPIPMLTALQRGEVSFEALCVLSKLKSKDDEKTLQALYDDFCAGYFSLPVLADTVKHYLKHGKLPPLKEGPDYASPRIKKLIKMVSKQEAVFWLNETSHLALNEKDEKKRAYLQGKLNGMEIFAKLQIPK